MLSFIVRRTFYSVLILLGVLTSDGSVLQWRKKEAAHEQAE